MEGEPQEKKKGLLESVAESYAAAKNAQAGIDAVRKKIRDSGRFKTLKGKI